MTFKLNWNVVFKWVPFFLIFPIIAVVAVICPAVLKVMSHFSDNPISWIMSGKLNTAKNTFCNDFSYCSD